MSGRGKHINSSSKRVCHLLKNSIKNKLLAGEAQIGIVSDYGSHLITEELSLLGFDYVIIDHQHGAWNHDRIMAAIRGILLGKAMPIVRVEQNDFATIGKVLDLGALGVIVPMVSSVSEASVF